MYLFDLKDDCRIIYIWICVKGGGGIPLAPLGIQYEKTPGLASGCISIDNHQIGDCDIITKHDSIEIDLAEIDRLHPELSILSNLESGRDINIFLKYEESSGIIKEGNMSKVIINFRSDFASTNTTLFFSLPKISQLDRFLLAFIDITERKAYEILSPFEVDITIHQKIFAQLKNRLKEFIDILEAPIDERNVIAYFTVQDKYIERLGGFSYYLPKINKLKLLIKIFQYFVALIIGALIGRFLAHVL